MKYIRVETQNERKDFETIVKASSNLYLNDSFEISIDGIFFTRQEEKYPIDTYTGKINSSDDIFLTDIDINQSFHDFDFYGWYDAPFPSGTLSSWNTYQLLDTSNLAFLTDIILLSPTKVKGTLKSGTHIYFTDTKYEWDGPKYIPSIASIMKEDKEIYGEVRSINRPQEIKNVLVFTLN